jgi:KUP system potassium uptake protein
MPALMLNYFGQGALLLRDPAAVQNPFFLTVPSWGLYPMVGLATLAAIVASQALISGAFSLTNQAVQLGYCPRVTVRHTSSTEFGQIYVPEVNWALGLGTVALVLAFRSSSALASAYGIAVTGTMAITTLLFHRVARDRWRWPRWTTWPLSSAFLLVDGAFLSANVVKVADGGWFPLLAAGAIFVLMSTWKLGRSVLARRLADAGLPLPEFIASLERSPPHRVSGTAVFMTSNTGGAPPVLLHHLKHNKVLHERVLVVSVLTASSPFVKAAQRSTVRGLGAGFYQVIGQYGFMERPNVPALLAALPPGSIPGPSLEQSRMQTTYYLGRETLIPSDNPGMSGWRQRLFIVMSRNAQTASSFFGLPPNRVVEMGAQIEL